MNKWLKDALVRIANPGKWERRLYARNYYHEHRGRILAQMRKRRKKEGNNTYAKDYYTNNREHIRAQQRTYYQQNRGK